MTAHQMKDVGEVAVQWIVQHFNSKTSRLIALGIAICLSLLWINIPHDEIGGFRSKKPTTPPASSPRIGQQVEQGRQTTRSEYPTLDIVISMYHEPLEQTGRMIRELKALDAFKHLSITEYVYTKDIGADLEFMKRKLNTSRVAILHNTGREAGTYLSHITNNYDQLARHTMFIQAEMHEYEHALNRINDWFQQDTGVLSLGQYEACNCVGCHDKWNVGQSYPRIPEIYSALYGQFCPKEITTTRLSQIIVSSKRIRSRSLHTYMYFKSVLESPLQSDAHMIGDFVDDQSVSHFVETLERAYQLLWGCGEASLAKRCGGLSSLRSRRTSDQPDSQCQCLDTRFDTP